MRVATYMYISELPGGEGGAGTFIARVRVHKVRWHLLVIICSTFDAVERGE